MHLPVRLNALAPFRRMMLFPFMYNDVGLHAETLGAAFVGRIAEVEVILNFHLEDQLLHTFTLSRTLQ